MKKLIVFIFLFTSNGFSNELIFSKRVGKKEKSTIEKDLKFLKGMNFTKDFDQKTLKLFKTEKIDNEFLLSWFFERVQYVFSKYELSGPAMARNLEIFDPVFEFEYPLTFPDELLGNNYLDSRNGDVVMSNVGTALYIAGKKEKMLLSLKMKTQTETLEIPLSSPRVGILRIGKNFYMNASSSERDLPEQRILRVATLFHEARHSDGHAQHLGFLHSICPKGHDFEGERACDSSTNGPYSIDAYLAYEMAFNCKECDLESREMLKLRVLDSLSRVIADTDDFEAHFFPDAPEGKRQ